jgi:hypothetical protein
MNTQSFTMPSASLHARSRDPLHAAVGAVVGTTFYGTLMKQMRETRCKGAYGHGGRGEEVFAAQLHGLLAERMGEARRDPLQKAMVHQLQRRVKATSPGHSENTAETTT